MILYNVTIGIDKDVEQEWLEWTKAEYIPKIMETGLFVEFKIYKVLHDQDDGGVSYSIQFFAHTINHITIYFDHYAPNFLEQLRTRFRDKHVAFMTLLEEV